MNSSRGGWAGAGQWRWAAAGGAELTVALPSVLAGLSLAGLAGNLLLGAVLLHQLRRGRSGPPAAHALLLNLCAADLLLALFCLPTRIAAYSRQPAWPLGGFLCRASDWLLHACLAAKSFTWGALGQARYRHLLLLLPPPPPPPPPKGPGWGGGRLAGVLAAVWGAAALLPLPLFLFTRLEGAPQGRRPPHCVFRPPAHAANFMEVFGKVYPLAAYLAPAAFTWAGLGRALRLQRARGKNRLAKTCGSGGGCSPQSRRATRTLLGLSLLFQALWLPEWVVWLWERQAAPLGGRRNPPPAALAFLAEALLFLDAALKPAVFGAASQEFREGLSSLWGALMGTGGCRRGKEGGGPGETPQPARGLEGEAAAAPEKVLPDVEHFWKDRRSTGAGEESDPVPWEHQCDP